ncbi:NAD(P)-dependent oxidoreductase [Leifsonia sp. 22587]|uniref:NAD(P)-dependent oxidoreductase n=1 Tax=Leifsonia sp. 22587 TaxID=3453946 RepID=UPI003F829940
MRIVVFGANGPTGRLLVSQSLQAGHTVTAVTRRPDAFPRFGAALRVVAADVHDVDAVSTAVAGHDAVLSSLGVPYSRGPVTVYSEGAAHILSAMERHAVRRLVCVSASLVEPQLGPHGGFLVDKVAGPLVRYFGRTVYADMARMEALVRASDTEWTIMRPSGLFETAQVTEYRTAEDYLNASFTSRADLAEAMRRQLDSDEFVRKVCAVGTFDEKPSLLRLLLREGSSRRGLSMPDHSADSHAS